MRWDRHHFPLHFVGEGLVAVASVGFVAVLATEKPWLLVPLIIGIYAGVWGLELARRLEGWRSHRRARGRR